MNIIRIVLNSKVFKRFILKLNIKKILILFIFKIINQVNITFISKITSSPPPKLSEYKNHK